MDSAMLASAETGNIEVLKLLITNGGEINCANDKDETPLIIARNKGHMEYVRYRLYESAGEDGDQKQL